jgi:hypothetical protein
VKASESDFRLQTHSVPPPRRQSDTKPLTDRVCRTTSCPVPSDWYWGKTNTLMEKRKHTIMEAMELTVNLASFIHLANRTFI